MNRMTERDDKGNLLFDGKQVYAGDFYEAASCLEEYEDTGLTPGQIREMQKLLSRENTPETARSSQDNDGWIPGKEKPAEDGFYVATMSGALVDRGEPFVGLAEFEDGNWVDGDDVIAWRPLPDPYRPERSNDEKE